MLPLSDERVALRPIERSDLARLAELLEDPEVAGWQEKAPVVLASLGEWEKWFEQRAADPPKDSLSFALSAGGVDRPGRTSAR
jgi:RimJ/RimL family protein N-acetyltransferase